MKKKSLFSRRRFLALSAMGMAGSWIGLSDQFTPRTTRKLFAELGRSIAPPTAKPTPKLWSGDAVTCAWLGHASVLINFFGFTILTDPVLSRRIGMGSPLGTLGPKRLVAPALSANELPPLDLILLSHAHMDHLDFPTLSVLGGRNVVTAAATQDLLAGFPALQPTELRWGESTSIRGREGDLRVEAFEVKHWGARWRYDNHRGYNGYLLSRGNRSLIFGGDTALCSTFQNLGRSPSIAAAIMPIGSYLDGPSMHCTPEEAARMVNEGNIDRLLAVHHKTFPLGSHSPDEPIERLRECLDRERVGFENIGETIVL